LCHSALLELYSHLNVAVHLATFFGCYANFIAHALVSKHLQLDIQCGDKDFLEQ